MAELWATLEFAEKLYLIVIISFIPLMLAGFIASAAVNATFRKYASVPSPNGLTAAQAARNMLDENGLQHIPVQRIGGSLTDNYNPKTQVVSLSQTVYGSSSIAAVGVACHECGHAVQHDKGYVFSRVRTALVPVLNVANRLLMPIMLVGMLLGFLATSPLMGRIGTLFVVSGLIIFGLSALFALVTLPTEINASRRAIATLKDCGAYGDDEIASARKVLTAAAMTYVVSFLLSLAQFLRFLAIILMSTRNRRD